MAPTVGTPRYENPPAAKRSLLGRTLDKVLTTNNTSKY